MIENLEKISTNGRYLFLAYDHGLEHGPVDFNEKSVDANYVLEIATKGKYNGIVLQKGVAEKYYPPYLSKVPLILKLNGKTNLWEGEAYSPQECSVAFAKALGAKAVGYTLYLGSEYEYKMVQEFGRIVEEAHKLKLPVIGWIYPRGKYIKNDQSPEIVAYAARAGLELGADMVKIKYSGSKESFSWAVRAAGKTKVVLSGGPKVSENEFLKIVRNIMTAEAVGVAVGRNVWQHQDPLGITKKLKQIIFGKQYV